VYGYRNLENYKQLKIRTSEECSAEQTLASSGNPYFKSFQKTSLCRTRFHNKHTPVFSESLFDDYKKLHQITRPTFQTRRNRFEYRLFFAWTIKKNICVCVCITRRPMETPKKLRNEKYALVQMYFTIWRMTESRLRLNVFREYTSLREKRREPC